MKIKLINDDDDDDFECVLCSTAKDREMSLRGVALFTLPCAFVAGAIFLHFFVLPVFCLGFSVFGSEPVQVIYCEVLASIHRKVWGPSPSAEEYPGPDSVLVSWYSLTRKGDYNIVSQYHMHKCTSHNK